MSDMSNEEIIESFDALFESNEDVDEPEDDKPESEDIEDTPADESSEEEVDESKDGEGEKEEEDTEKEPSVSKDSKSKQNYKFAEMRNKLKSQETLLKNLGKAIGLEEGTSVEEVASKVNEVLLKKQSQETGIPEEVLQRLQTLEAMAANNQQQERQTKAQNDIANLIEKYSLSEEQLNTFIQQLVESGRNPMEVDNVDLETEYIKSNYQTLMQQAVDKAKAEERERQLKAESKSGSSVGGSADAGGSDKKIKSVKDLDSFFDGLDL